MSKTPDEIMDDLAARTEEIVNKQLDAASAIFWGEGKDQDDTWLWVLMVEAHKAGGDPMMAKLAYLRGDIAEVDTSERIKRLSGASAYASNWEIKMKAANASLKP